MPVTGQGKRAIHFSAVIDSVRKRTPTASKRRLFVPSGRRARRKIPAVFLIWGADSCAEQNYFSGRGIIDRGMTMLLLDSPGRGSAIYLKGIPARPDYEVSTRIALDWLAAQGTARNRRLRRGDRGTMRDDATIDEAAICAPTPAIRPSFTMRLTA